MSQEDFDVNSLAAYLHITPQQLERLASRGKVPGRKVGGKWLFKFADIHHWMEQRMGILEDDELQRVEAVMERETAETTTTAADMLAVESIGIPLTAKTKRSTIKEMVELAANTGMLWDPERMIEAVLAREELQTTALPNGVALLHPRRPLSNALGEPLLAWGVSPQGIPFGGGRGLTSVFFLICSTDDRIHLHTLARLSRMLAPESDFIDRLRAAETPAEAKQIFAETEGELPS